MKISRFCFLFFLNFHLIAQQNPLNTNEIFEPATERTQNQLNGFAGDNWLTPYSSILDKFKTLSKSSTTTENIQILNAQRNQYILIKRNNAEYQYNFYKTPFEVLKLENHDLKFDEYDQIEGVLFHVRIILPFIESKLLEEKIQSVYGKKTRSTFDEKTLTGADIWDLEGGYIFLWYEPLNQKTFSRRIDYLSKDLTRRILEESKDYFDSNEKSILKEIIIK